MIAGIVSGLGGNCPFAPYGIYMGGHHRSPPLMGTT